MPTRAEFEEKKHKRSSLGTFAEKPAEPKARISLAPGAADPVTTAPTASVRKLEEDEVPTTTPDGAKIVDFADGVAHYSDGSSYSAEGWKDSGLDVSYEGTDTVTEEQVSGRAATAKYGAKRRQAEQARAAVERAAIARERARRIEARRKQLRDRSAKLHGEPLDATYANFYGQFDKEGIKRLKDKYLWTVQDNSIEQNLVLARRLGWPTGKGKDGHTFIVTPWGTRYRGNKPKKPKKPKKARKKAKPQGFWHGFTSSGGTVTIEELRARVHRTPIITASAADLRARVHGSKAVMATATSAWNSGARKGAAAKGIALPDGSYPIKDKTDWAKAKQALGRAKNRAVVVKHLIKRAKALGIPAEQYKGLTASSNTGMVAAMGDWDPLLHPRARDGKFIDVGGFISAIARWGSPTGNDEGSQRAKVVRVEPNPKDPTDPFIVVQDEKHGDKLGYVEASNVDKVVAPAKGSVSKKDDDDDKQLSLADAPVGGNKEMPKADDYGVDPVTRRARSLFEDYDDFGPALKKYTEIQADYGVNKKKDDFGRSAGRALTDEELSEAVDELNTRVLDPDFQSMSGKVELRLLMEEQMRRGLLPQMSDDPIDPEQAIENFGLDEGMLYADDQGRERYDANEAAVAERGAANEKVWRTDLAKVQQALEEGGWITSTPDADAPGGTFTYIDPDAPPELVALYQKLIQFGYANGYEP